MSYRSSLLLTVFLTVQPALFADDAAVETSSEAGPTTIFEEQVLVTGGAEQVESLPGSADFSNLTQIIVALGIGLIAGFFAGLAGIGGGVVIVPASVLLLGLEQHEAQGTSLVAMASDRAAAVSPISVGTKRMTVLPISKPWQIRSTMPNRPCFGSGRPTTTPIGVIIE